MIPFLLRACVILFLGLTAFNSRGDRLFATRGKNKISVDDAAFCFDAFFLFFLLAFFSPFFPLLSLLSCFDPFAFDSWS